MLSARVGGIDPQSTTTNGPRLRRLASWIARATTSLPVPVSPSMSTLSSVPAIFSSVENTRRMFGDAPTIEPNRSA